jgi:diguanylate cyclase (GGDEF)-like protein
LSANPCEIKVIDVVQEFVEAMLVNTLEAQPERLPLNVRGWLYGMDALDASGCSTLLRGCLLALVDATPGLVMVSSSKGQMLYMNVMGRQMLGFDRNTNLTTRRVFDLYSQRSCELLLEEAIPTCLQAGVWRGETTLLDRDKQEIPVSQVLMAHRVKEQDGRDTTVLSSIAWDIRELKQVEQRLRHQATHDSLTGLPNRALLMDRLGQAIHAAERNSTCVGVLFVDLDGFKEVNDTCGHEAANLLLRELAQRLQQRVRAQDTIARYGGDEFVLVVSDLTLPGDMNRVLQQVQEALAEPFQCGKESRRLAASIGVSMYPLDGQDAETLLQGADTRMYEQKRHLKLAS